MATKMKPLEMISVEEYESKHGKGSINSGKINKAMRKAQADEVCCPSALSHASQ
jgi:hypothetical protein